MTGGLRIRFYAGMPIRARDGSATAPMPMGTLCVIDAEPRQLDDAGYQTLRAIPRTGPIPLRGPQHRPGHDAACRGARRTINAQGAPLRVRSIGELERPDGEAVALVGVFQDITGRHAMEQALRHTAHIDELTRLANRSRLNQFLDDRIALARGRRDSVALLLIDLDHFKAVNDRCGHLVGSFVARLVGDEFVLVITCPTLLADLPGVLRRRLGDLRYTVEAGGAASPPSWDGMGSPSGRAMRGGSSSGWRCRIGAGTCPKGWNLDVFGPIPCNGSQPWHSPSSTAPCPAGA